MIILKRKKKRAEAYIEKVPVRLRMRKFWNTNDHDHE